MMGQEAIEFCRQKSAKRSEGRIVVVPGSVVTALKFF